MVVSCDQIWCKLTLMFYSACSHFYINMYPLYTVAEQTGMLCIYSFENRWLLNIVFSRILQFYSCTVGPQNAPLHNMLLLVAYCVPCIHNMLRWSILCTLHTQYATSGAYCVGSTHMLFQWSSEGTQYALLENMSRGICLSF